MMSASDPRRKARNVQDIWTTRTLADAYMVRDVLAQEDIAATIRNEHLIGVVGEVPVNEAMPTIAVAPADAHRAQALLRELLADAPAALERVGSGVEADDAQGVMSDLHAAATRLVRDGAGEAIDRVHRYGTQIARSAAPFGVEPGVWSQIAAFAEATVAAADDEEALRLAAAQLRDVLAPLV